LREPGLLTLPRKVRQAAASTTLNFPSSKFILFNSNIIWSNFYSSTNLKYVFIVITCIQNYGAIFFSLEDLWYSNRLQKSGITYIIRYLLTKYSNFSSQFPKTSLLTVRARSPFPFWGPEKGTTLPAQLNVYKVHSSPAQVSLT
jgi:hypothetical protein